MRTLLIDENFDVTKLHPSLHTLYNMYMKGVVSRSTFKKLLHLKSKNLELFIERCKQLCKGVKFDNFRQDRKKFEVRITHNGKKVSLGTFDDFDDAVDVLKQFIELKQTEQSI